jgi:hypothetical protein
MPKMKAFVPFQESPRNTSQNYGIPPPPSMLPFSISQLSPPPASTVAVNDAYLPPTVVVRRTLDLVQVGNRVTHQQEEAIRIQRELRIRESLMYEQLERAAAAAAKATATANSFKIGLSRGSHVAYFPYQGAPHLPPWMTGGPSSPAAYIAMPPTSALPASEFLHCRGSIVAGQPCDDPLPPPNSVFALPRHHHDSEAVAVLGAHVEPPNEKFYNSPLPPPHPEFALLRHHHDSEAIAVGAQVEPPPNHKVPPNEKVKCWINGQNSFPVGKPLCSSCLKNSHLLCVSNKHICFW